MKFVVAFISLLLVLFLLIIGVSYYYQPKDDRDISWIENVNELIEELKPFPEYDSIPYPRSFYLFHLYENGTGQLIWHGGTTDSVSYLKSLLNQVNYNINASITSEFKDKILISNKVLRFEFRFYEDFQSVKTVQIAYFVLNDNLNLGLKGTIIIRRNIIGEGRYSIWEIKG